MYLINLYHKRLVALTTVVLSISLVSAESIQAATYSFNWTGQIDGYKIDGLFSFDETNIPNDGIIRQANLQSFDVNFRNPDGSLIEMFADNHLNYPYFNFNFDTNTKEILQDGNYNQPNGIDIGERALEIVTPPNYQPTSGLNFWSFAGSTGTNPHVHITAWNGEYGLPQVFSIHTDVAFFNRTTAQLGFPNAPNANEFGQRVTVSPIPEPSSLLGLLGIGLLGVSLRRSH